MPLNETIPNTPDTADRSTCPRWIAGLRQGTDHGSENAYVNFDPPCRCADAREARRLYTKRLREGRQPPGHVPALGSARRLQALSANGWSVRKMAAECGVPWPTLHDIIAPHRPSVTPARARPIREMYNRLATVEGPSPAVAKRSRGRGWIPPDEWLPDELDDPEADPRAVPVAPTTIEPDELIVQAALTGDVPLARLTLREQEMAVGVIAERICWIDVPALRGEEAARQLGCTPERYQVVLDRVRARDRRAQQKDEAA